MDQQQALPFGQVYAERRAKLVGALNNLGVTLEIRCLVLDILFEGRLPTVRGWRSEDRELVLEDLRPLEATLGLCCQASRVRKILAQAQASGLLFVEQLLDTRGRPTAGRRIAFNWRAIEQAATGAWVPFQNEGVPFQNEGVPFQNEGVPGGFCNADNGKENGKWDCPRAGAGAPSAQTVEPPSAPTATVGAEVETDRTKVRERACEIVCRLWPNLERRPKRITDRRDQRLIYRLTVLAHDPKHREWARRLIREVGDSKANSPLAKLQADWAKFAPAWCERGRMLASIDVPAWALANPVEWDRVECAPNGECVQRE